ncbi:MAG: LuxR C-terminal-related transcriptional regulator [Gallionella sp.]|nr:LuxR C-terminal-related transcriptional regulator [Gallionella sp.]
MTNIRHLFIAPEAQLRASWREAFPEAALCDRVPANPATDVIWVLLPEEGDIVKLLSDCRFAAGKLPVIAISDLPSDQQGLIALGAGVVGYCNGHAAPAVLRQVANTALEGGLWVGRWLLQRLLSGIARAAAVKFTPPALSEWASSLTASEIAVARIAAGGLGNKEIADRLNIAEHMVKAQLESVFGKLKLRDRLHLTLLVNGVVKPR